ncbi:MAG: hypothetical protein FJZ13_05075 [Candidatus Omnitrophica bacterium]|nr:hypothetical protein [Candidatus Omnitrophota bacterium]
MRAKIIIGTSLFLLFSAAVSFAGWERPQARWTQLYRWDDRRDHNQLYINRLAVICDYLDAAEKSLFKITPYFEARRNIIDDIWVREELGVEIGKDIFPWFYLGEAVQKVWAKEDYHDYRDYKRNDCTESETRILFSHSLLPDRYFKLIGFALNEYTYEFDRGAGTRNEVAIGLTLPIGRFVETTVNWRHIDRIHYYDSDALEGSVTLIF